MKRLPAWFGRESGWPMRLANWITLMVCMAVSFAAFAQDHTPGKVHGGEASLVLPDFSKVTFARLGGIDGQTLLYFGLVVCAFGLLFGAVIYTQLKNLPVHARMKEISELIYETCKTYLETQGKFILILELFIGGAMVAYFSMFAIGPDGQAGLSVGRVAIIILFSLIGIAGSYGVAWYGIRVNTFANSRTAFASLEGKAYPVYAIPLKAGMSIGMMLISIELMLMLFILLFMPRDLAGACFIGFAIGESLGASALRIAGGIFTKIADIGSDLMKIVFKIKEDDARNPGVIADCTGDNAGDSVGPSADGFETYGVTGVALISFILLAVSPAVQVELLVWIFVIRIVMVVASAASYGINETIAKSRYAGLKKMNFEAPLTSLVILTSIISIILTFIVSYLLIPVIGIGAGASSYWWKFSIIISCGTAAGAIIPELVKAFTSTESRHVREVVTASKEGGASLNVLAGLTAGNFSAYWMGITFIVLMGISYIVTLLDQGTPEGLGAIMTLNKLDVSSVFAFGLVAFGFLGMGPVTIAVDSYGPVTDNAQSVYELSLIENVSKEDIKRDHGIDVDFTAAKELLEENDGAGNTFKATAKPVLIGTAVVGATTMIFSIIVVLTGLQTDLLIKLSLLHPPFLLGMLAGGSMIYWFTGASTQAVSTGAYRAVEFIKQNIKLDDKAEKASIEDSKKVVAICTEYAQKGMLNIFCAVVFATLAFSFLESYFFIGYLISLALFGLFQAIFLANAGGAWDNAKKVVETELKMKNTPLHDASIVGDTVGDPFKDTSSVAMNPVIKFTTLFGLLAVELAEQIGKNNAPMRLALAFVLFVFSAFFVHRSFYGMRIDATADAKH
jgi:K(+)-stimulated pyrophosphate-energized sodium pump